MKEKKPTEKQLRVLDRIGSKARPTTRAEAQALIDRHYRPQSRRRQKPTRKTAAARRRRGTKRRPKGQSGRYYLTPKVWKERCDQRGCENPAIAYRPFDHAYACEPCIERLGIEAHESKAWRDGGSKAGSAVTIRHVDPESLRSPPTPSPESRP
jgi:hypothetical protein